MPRVILTSLSALIALPRLRFTPFLAMSFNLEMISGFIYEINDSISVLSGQPSSGNFLSRSAEATITPAKVAIPSSTFS